MKLKPCSYAQCGERRIHWMRPDEPRGVQTVEVPDEYEGPAYCSITCAVADGAMSLKCEETEPCK